jgi:acetyltransferase-like isoleucine patch superfamily enzyme
MSQAAWDKTAAPFPSAWRGLRHPLRTAARRLGRGLARWAENDAPRRPDALADLVQAGHVHPTVQWWGDRPSIPAGARVSIGEDSIFCGSLMFHRPGAFRMGRRSYVGPRTEIRVTTAIELGEDVLISWGCTLLDTDMHSPLFSVRCRDVLIEGGRAGLTLADKDWSAVRCRPIVIYDKAWIAMGVIILPGVTIGEGCIVGAGSVVTRDLPAWTLAAGNPARAIRPVFAAERETAARQPAAEGNTGVPLAGVT